MARPDFVPNNPLIWARNSEIWAQNFDLKFDPVRLDQWVICLGAARTESGPAWPIITSRQNLCTNLLTWLFFLPLAIVTPFSFLLLHLLYAFSFSFIFFRTLNFVHFFFFLPDVELVYVVRLHKKNLRFKILEDLKAICWAFMWKIIWPVKMIKGFFLGCIFGSLT